MNNLDAILEVAIGLVFAWLILSLASMQVQEWIGTKLAWRSKFLEDAIFNMLRDDKMVDDFYNHPLIKSLSEPPIKRTQKKTEKAKKKAEEKAHRKPSYIPAEKFATVAFDVIMSADNPEYKSGNTSISVAQILKTIKNLEKENPDLARTLEGFFPNLYAKTASAEFSIAQIRGKTEKWFDDSMDRLSGWYKRHSSKWALGIGIVLAFLINVDSIEIAQQLWREPTMRQAIIAQAGQATTEIDVSSPEKLENYYENLTIPVGWITVVADEDMACGWLPGQDTYPSVWVDDECRVLTNLPKMNDGWGWVVKFIGIVLSGIAAAQGAPFWFEMLKKLINVRGSGNVPAKAESKPDDVE